MKLRWKFLLILAILAIIPLVVLRFITKRSSHELVHDMTTRSREVLIQRAKTDLLRRMEDHARIVNRERLIVNLALKNQSGRLRQVLEGKEKRIGRMRNKGLVNSTKHFDWRQDGSHTPIKVDYDKVRIELTKDATVTMDEAKKMFQPMIRPFRKLEKANPDLIYWQIVRLKNGIIATYPYYEITNPKQTHAEWMASKKHAKETLPSNSKSLMLDVTTRRDKLRGFPPHIWYQVTQDAPPGVFWTVPFTDPVTGQLIVAAINGIQEFKKDVQGAVMIMVPLGTVLKGDLDLTGLSKNTTSLLVRPETVQSESSGLRIIAEEHKGQESSQNHEGWMAGIDEKWLKSADAASLDSIGRNIKNGKSGTIQANYKGKDSLWIYAPIKLTRTALVMIVPMKNIFSSIIKTENYVKNKIESRFSTVSALIWVLAAIVLVISLILSKTMTKRISNLALAFRRLAKGDFSTRVDARGKDEISNLSASFNELAPSLEEQVRIKEALTIAQEVQRSLLPEKPPQVKGLDVAGMSLYCEDTGGDYFDYPHLGIEADELGLAVGDVSGHGVPAALLMTTARALLRQRAQRGGNLGSVVGDANQMLSEDVRLSGRFMTLFLFAVDLDTHTARWVRAGHDPALMYLPSTDTFSELGGDTGLPLGVDEDWEYVEEHTTLEEGAIILIGTDGIWEATNEQDEMYGKERLNTIMRDNASASSQEILDTILKSLKNFVTDSGFEDDVTLAVVKVLKL